MIDKIKVAGVQMNPLLMEKEKNLTRIVERTKEAAKGGATLIVFPECALTGYVYLSREEAIPFAETIPGPATEMVEAICRESQVYVIFGLLEKAGEKFYNSAAFLGPSGLIGIHRKVHLPDFAVDAFVDQSKDPFRVFETPIGNIGMMICYDNAFPESARILSLKGADIVVVSTNWPQGREMMSKLVPPVRAFENGVNLVAVDRVGMERGWKFLGVSKVVDPIGDVLVEASSEKEEIIFAELSLSQARKKDVTITKSESSAICKLDRFENRRPDLYGEITK